MSAQEAFRSLGNTILNSVINSIVQIGVEALKTHSRADSWSGIRGFLSWYGCNHGNRMGTCCCTGISCHYGAKAAPASAGITSTVGLAQGLALLALAITAARYLLAVYIR
jgi:hypothetical protein